MSPPLSPMQYQSLLRLACRHARVKDEAEDLLHDALIAAVAAGRLPWREGTAWFNGILRKRAAMDARSSIRRRRRDAQAAAWREPENAGLPPPWPAIAGLSSALRIVALLILTGHNRAEICHLLRISDETLRQRLAALRRRLQTQEPEGPLAEFTGLAEGFAFGSVRRALLPAMRDGKAHLGSHDPDGHLFIARIASDGAHKKRLHGN
jgi:DNA-directed RNA polymerase specialized sigma24 family protein